MLDLFRKRGLSSVVYGFIIVATGAVFVIQFRPNAGQKSASFRQTCVATVRGFCIEPRNYKAVYRVLTPRDRSSGAPQASRAKAMGLNRIALDGLIERELLLGEAERLGIRITDQEVTDSIYDGNIYISVPSDRPELFSQFPVAGGRVYPQMYGAFRDPKTKQFDVKVYERTLRFFMGRSPSEFRDEQTRELLAARVRDVLRAPIRVSDLDAEQAYTREKSQASLAYVPVKTSYVAKYMVSSTKADVDGWLKTKENADALEEVLKGIPEAEKPKASHIRHILIKVEPTASDSEKTAALNRLADAVRRIRAGERFEDVAKEVSEDRGSAANGGDVGDKTDGFVAPFKKAADALAAGEVTKAAIETQFGYHYLKKDDPNPELLKQEVARSLYVKAQAQQVAKTLAETIAKSMVAGTKAEIAVAEALAPYFKKAPTYPELESVPEERPAAADAGAPATKPRPIVSRNATLDDDSSKPRPETTQSFNRGGDPIAELDGETTAKVTSFAFDTKDVKEGSVLPSPVASKDGFLVVQLQQRKTATKEEFAKDRETYTQSLLAAKQAEALALYVKKLRESAKGQIKIDEQYLDEGASKKDGGAPLPEEEGED